MLAQQASMLAQQEKLREDTRIMRVKAERERRAAQAALEKLEEDRKEAEKAAAHAKEVAQQEAEDIRRQAQYEARRLNEQAEAAKAKAEAETKKAQERAALSESLAIGALKAAQEAETVRKLQHEAKLKELEANGIVVAKPAEVATDCCICLDIASVMAFVPCGHICTCQSCAAMCAGKPCPVCRVRVREAVRTYRT
jgi:E3 ubiquitin-protein ligase XIAP/baculoviral IAP repeat-containing protein 2/3